MLLFNLFLVCVADDPTEGLAKKMLPIYVKEISEYSLTVESAPKQVLELKKEPVFEWSNPIRKGIQQVVIFLWLREGRPAAVGCIFSEPAPRLKGRKVIHELHALDREKLQVSRPSGSLNEWRPQAGLERKELPNAGAPAATPGARLVQMRRLAQEFRGHEVDGEGKRLDLRVLSTPLYRYPDAKSGVEDGALFALVSEEGTDPEVLLILETHREGGKDRWEYACGRFSDRNLFIQRKDKEVWSSILNRESNNWSHDPLHLYRTYPDKIVTTEGKLLARIRATDRSWWGIEVIPVGEK